MSVGVLSVNTTFVTTLSKGSRFVKFQCSLPFSEVENDGDEEVYVETLGSKANVISPFSVVVPLFVATILYSASNPGRAAFVGINVNSRSLIVAVGVKQKFCITGVLLEVNSTVLLVGLAV